MKSWGMKASWILPVLLAGSGLFITGLSDTAPEAQAEGEEAAAVEKAGEASAPVTTEALQSSAPEPSKVTLTQSGRITSKGCLTDEAAVEDMQKLKVSLEERAKALTQRETELKQKETALAEELQKIEAVRDEIKQINQVSIAKNEEKINKLVETFEGMSPKAAAQVVTNIEQALAVAALSKLSSPKLGKILAAMSPEEAGPLTEALAGVVRASKKPASKHAAATTNPGKGGEKEHGNTNNNERQPAGREPQPATGG